MGLIAAIITTAISLIVDPTGGNIKATSSTTVNATTKIVDPTGGNIVDPTGGNH